MKHLLIASLLASVAMAAPNDAGSNKPAEKSQADKAREAAEQRKREQAEADEKAAKDREAEAEKAREFGHGGGDAGGPASPAVDPEKLDVRLLMERIEQQGRLIEMLQQGMAGTPGPATDAPKSTVQVGPGASIEAPMVGKVGDHVTSGPALQPHPASVGAGSPGVGLPDGANAWAVEGGGRKVKAKVYRSLTDEDVQVLRTGYHDDVIRNPGEIIVGYTGPVASWFIPVRAAKDRRLTEQWNDMFRDGAEVLEDAAA